MNRNTLTALECEARHLRAAHTGDRLLLLVIAIDLEVRRLAYRIADYFLPR
jgi:hypothetical protein